VSAHALASARAGSDASLWLPLLRKLTRSSDEWAVQGDVDEGFSRKGDIDLIAREDQWSEVEAQFTEWTSALSLGPVVVCRHRPGKLILVAVNLPERRFLELEVLGRKYFKGGELFAAEQLVPLTHMDPRGFRVVRPGARALTKLIPNGIGRLGDPKWPAAKRARVAANLRVDPTGYEMAADLLDWPTSPVLALARSVAAGGWDRGAALQLSSWGIAHSFRHPLLLIRRGARAAIRRPRCVLLKAVSNDHRTIPGDPDVWIQRVAKSHRIDLERSS
jgi:hypothetical protein